MIELKNVNKYYNYKKSNEIHVIDNTSLNLPSKGLVSIYGASGCGKTTLLNVIGGLDNFDSGDIIIDNIKVNKKNNDDIRNKYIGYIFQNYNLENKLTVYENIALSLRLIGVKDEKIIYENVLSVLKIVEMDKYYKRYPNTLSGGQQQRVAIARALVKNPKIILADEPTGNLDTENTYKIMNILKSISKTKLVILVSHETDVIKYYSDFIVNIKDGKILDLSKNIIEEAIINQNKNNIYLKELEEKTFKIDNLKLDIYTDSSSINNFNIKLVIYDGKLYLKNDNNINIIDKNSEINLIDSKKPIIKNNLLSEEKNDIILNEFNYQKVKIFSALQSFLNGIKDNFIKPKAGKKVLYFILTLLSIIICLLTGILLKKYETLGLEKNLYEDNVIYLNVNNNSEYDKLLSLINDDITYIEYTKNYDTVAKKTIYLYDFETYEYSFDINMIETPISRINENNKLIIGIENINNYNECLISSTLAENIIKKSNVKSVKEYKDLIGLRISNYIIKGIIKDNKSRIYYDNIIYYENFYSANKNFRYPDIGSLKRLDSEYQNISDLEVVFVDYGNGMKYEIGQTVNLYGNRFIVTNVIDASNNKDLYDDKSFFLTDNSLKKVLTYKYEATIINGGKTKAYIYKIKTKNYEETLKLLLSNFSESNVLDSNEFKNLILKTQLDNAKSNLISYIVIFAILFICLYFILKSIITSKIKDIGILRAIGVKKKSLYYKFIFEGLGVLSVTVISSYLVMSLLFFILLDFGNAYNSYISYPIWAFLLLGFLIIFISIILIYLSLKQILKLTPAKILSKYDI